MSDSATPWTAPHQASLSSTVSQSLLKFMSNWVSDDIYNRFFLCCPLFLPSIFPSIRVFSNELALCIKWPRIGDSVSVLPMNIQGWFPLGLTGLMSLLSKGLSRVFSSITVWKHQFLDTKPSLWPNHKENKKTKTKSIALTIIQLCWIIPPKPPPSWIIALLWCRGLHNSMKLWAMPCRATQDGWVIVVFWQNMVNWRREMVHHSSVLAARMPRTLWKGKKMWHPKMSPLGWKVSNMLLGKSRGQLPIAPERMKWLGQSRNNAQLWKCLVVKGIML